MTTNKNSKKNSRALLEVAVIGMAGRFPGSQNIHEFWENLKNGVESITFFSNEEAEEAGASLELIENPNYVKAFGILEKAGYFDPSFFGYTPKEAEIMNPQMRVFHECAWEALEDAGYNPGSYDGLIGVYAGASSSFYWEAITLLSGKKNEIGNFAADQLTGIDLLTTRISYKLALRGPSSFIQTACSTSLVAIHWACRSLLSGECHIALAGGVKLDANQKQGYLYEEGMIQSPDGHCRSFDAAAKGIIIGNGIGIVVLKRLKNAIADRDHIYAVVKGSAINNDGNRKVGFTAPSVKGEAEVIRTAQAMAHVEPESVGYIETHGTGTPLGDPVEIEALTLAFNTDKRNYCPIGSIKSNIGHLGAAAGVAGFIKTILALKHRLIPPSLHCEIPNPGIDFKSSPFFVNNYLTEWEDNGYPRRAGVSSFGIGGTNAHVLLEEWPETSQSPGQCVGDPVSNGEPMAHPYRLILLSAKTGTALERMTKNLVDYFKKNPGINLAKAAYTLQVGRKGFEYRKMVVCSNRNEVIEKLSNPDSRRVLTFLSKGEERSIIFMFPGQGAQYVNMGLELYQKEKVFRDTVDYCFEILRPLMDYDIKQILYPNDSVSKGSGVSEMSEVSAENTYTSSNPYMSKYPHVSHINQTEIAQPLLFVFEYALARLLMNWGIQPNAMIGYSFGEYVAACTAGVFSVEDALKLVVARSKLIMELPVGFMVSVPLPVDETKPFINDQLSISIDNGLSCIVSGPPAEIEAFEKRMKEKRYMCIRLEHVSHAIHSKMMEPILEKFENIVRDIPLEKPRIPYISNVTGGWAKAEEVTVPRYWAKHMRETVQFAGGVSKLLEAEAIFLEIGPGKVLSTFVRQHNEHNNKKQESMVLNLVRSPGELWSDAEYILNRIGQLWLYGKSSDWDKFYQEKERHRISLPTYSFDDRQLLTETEIFKVAKKGLLRTSLYDKNPNIDEWFYIPVWEQSPLAVHYPSGKKTCRNWLLFIDDLGIGTRLMRRLSQAREHIAVVTAGEGYTELDDFHFIINPGNSDEYEKLFNKLRELNMMPDNIIHLWNVSMDKSIDNELEKINRSLDLGLYSLLHTAKAIGIHRISKDIHIQVLTHNMHHITGEEDLHPLQATSLGPVKVIPLEYPNISCRSVDVVLPPSGKCDDGKLPESLLAEFEEPPSEITVAYRWNQRWVRKVKPRPLKRSSIQRLKERGVYLVTGGFGGMGFAIAEDLAKRFKARLILVGRSPFPHRKEWEEWLSGSHNEEKVNSKIRKLMEFEKMGAEVMVASVDVSDEDRMRKVIARAEKKFGAINGILHTAGLADYEGVIQKRSRQMTEKILSPKVNGTIVLNRIFKGKKLDFMVLFSSVATFQYKKKFGQVGYIAANDFLDAFAHTRNMKNETFTVAINWTDWQEVGMAVEAVKKHFEREGKKIDPNALLRNYLSPIEGVEVFYRILGNKFCQVAVSTQDFVHLIESIEEMNREDKEEVNTSMVSTVLERPCLKSEYVAPGNEIEQTLATIWEEFFGLQEVGIHDDFFELGGDSLKAISLISHIEKKGYKISLNDILLRPTVHGLASVILGENTTEESPELKSYEELLLAGLDCVKKLNKGHNEKNIFLIHPMHGMVNQYIQLAVLLENKYNVYGIQARGVQSGLKMSESPVQMVNDYLEQILTVQKGGSYIIAGYCTGTTIAYEIVRKLERLNHHVEKLILFDTDMLFTDTFFKMIRPLRYLPDFVKRVILFFREREFKKAVKVENPGIINVDDGKEIACEDDLHKNRLIKHIRILGSYILPLEIIKAPILVPLAEASNYDRATETDFSKITGSKAAVIKTPGDHDSIFEKPDVEKLAELIINNI